MGGTSPHTPQFCEITGPDPSHRAELGRGGGSGVHLYEALKKKAARRGGVVMDCQAGPHGAPQAQTLGGLFCQPVCHILHVDLQGKNGCSSQHCSTSHRLSQYAFEYKNKSYATGTRLLCFSRLPEFPEGAHFQGCSGGDRLCRTF